MEHESPHAFEQARTAVDFRAGPVTSFGPPLRGAIDPNVASVEERGFQNRYLPRDLLGEGGMGEVRLHKDDRIGREVAVKTIRADHGARMDIQARFLREARVQGQLEHPSIVPVYDLGVGPAGASYFTMKRVHGLTLTEILDRLRAREAGSSSEYSLRTLLTAFGSVCLAVEFAHARRVLHRDLKPSNVMLGHFGEVYVLDWGIAKILEEPDDLLPQSVAADAQVASPNESGLKTEIGAFLGTLGYLSPEQFHNRELDGRSDVYALGAILFEILTLVPLHRGSLAEVVTSTLAGADARCSVRAPDREVPPELEAICVRATKLDPNERFESARALHGALQNYLDGDRDTERRRALAADHTRAAMLAIEASKKDEASRIVHRGKALAELGRSVALDPSNEAALGTIVRLLLEPPTEVPPEVQAKADASSDDSRRLVSRTGVVAFPAALIALVPFCMWMGLRESGWLALVAVFVGICTALCVRGMRQPNRAASYGVIVCCSLAYMLLSRIFGPLVFIPTITLATAMVYGMHPDNSVQRVALVAMIAASTLPLSLEWLGVLPASYAFDANGMLIVPHLCNLPATPTLLFLVTMVNVLPLWAIVGIRRIRNALTAAEGRLALQAWQLRQLVPEAARDRVNLGSAEPS
ncbi:MAG: Serine/threonine protein kinase PrkC, regulator of stationary phase [Myxococcaceae bacterium]|nr:Serine/threonine protein kinase PrkC, regulator of stationary phase [Myxococcaceae bacterium]